MHSSEWLKRAETLGRMAQKAPSLRTKQRLLAQQQRYQSMARATARREREDIPAIDPFDAAHNRLIAECAVSGPASSTHPAAVVARTEPPDAVRSSPYLLLLWTSGAVNRAELERRAESVRQLRERL